jgi:ABC-2 type transport system ATP-binding protein
MAMSTVLSVRNLTKNYGLTGGVSDISFQVKAGEIVGLLGPNGAGKTTTVECILGLRNPVSGQFLVNGIDSRSDPHSVRRIMGALLQSTALHDSITPREAVCLFASFYTLEPDTANALARFGILPQADVPFQHLSGGQRQRLALTLAFLHNPGLVILDEPSAGLDPAARRDLLDCIVAEKKRNCAILLCTHHIDEAARVCDQVIILDSGHPVAQGTPNSLLSGHPETVSIRLRASTIPDSGDLTSIPGITKIEQADDSFILSSNLPNQSIQAIGYLMERTGNCLTELHLQGANLEDAFIELTRKVSTLDPAHPSDPKTKDPE